MYRCIRIPLFGRCYSHFSPTTVAHPWSVGIFVLQKIKIHYTGNAEWPGWSFKKHIFNTKPKGTQKGNRICREFLKKILSAPVRNRSESDSPGRTCRFCSVFFFFWFVFFNHPCKIIPGLSWIRYAGRYKATKRDTATGPGKNQFERRHHGRSGCYYRHRIRRERYRCSAILSSALCGGITSKPYS